MDSDDARRALLTLLNLPDPERRFLGWKSGWVLPVVDEAAQSYGHRHHRRRFQPTAADMVLADAIAERLVELRSRHGRQALQLLFAWATGCQPWQIAQKANVTPRTIRNRLRTYLAHLGVTLIVERGPVHATSTPPAPGDHADQVTPARTWVGTRYTVNGRPAA